MIQIQPFRAYRPNPKLVTEIHCPPYDVIDTSEARQLANGKPNSFLHVIRSEIDFDENTSPYDDRVYQKAKENWRNAIAGAVFLREESPHFYVYRLTANGRSQIGLACVSFLDDYVNGKIKKHELTRKEKEEDRIKHVDAVDVNTEPVFFTYRSNLDPKIREILHDACKSTALYDVTADDGVRHEIFLVSDEAKQEDLIKRFQGLPCTYIADGHHRTASTARVGLQRREGNWANHHQASYNWFLSVIFPDEELEILPYNRVVKDLNGLSSHDFFLKLGDSYQIEADKIPSLKKGELNLYIDGKWHGLKPKKPATGSTMDQLDVNILQKQVLSPILGIDDPRSSDRISFVGGIRGDGELEKLVNSGKYKLAFSMHATGLQELFDVADANEIMPPKSTWFEPKLRSGFLVHSLHGTL